MASSARDSPALPTRQPVAAAHAVICPAGHHGGVPEMVLDISDRGGPPSRPHPDRAMNRCCPASLDKS